MEDFIMSKILEFKGGKYTFLELIKYASDERLGEYCIGEVVNSNTGEIFDISELKYKYDELNFQVLENLEHMSPYQRKRILECATKGYDEIRKSELEKKFSDNTITYEECKELLLIENYKKKDILKVRFNEFYMVNKIKDKPEGLSDDYYGKFFRLANYFMSVRNRLEYIKNGKPIKKEDIATHLGLKSTRAFDMLIKKLGDFNLVARAKIGNRKYIIINPAYLNMQFDISYEVYVLFKDDLDEILSPVEIRMLELSVIESTSTFIQVE
jgi:hypothetical protein